MTLPRATAYQNCKGPQSFLILQMKKKQTHEGKEVHGRNRTKTPISSPDLFPLLSRPPGFGPFPSIESSAFVPGEFWGKKSNQNKVKVAWQLEKWSCGFHPSFCCPHPQVSFRGITHIPFSGSDVHFTSCFRSGHVTQVWPIRAPHFPGHNDHSGM